MAHNSKATLDTICQVSNFAGSPLKLIKAKPNLLTSLLCPNTGYMQRVKEVYVHKKNNNNKNKIAGYSMDGLTLILDIEQTILCTFKWTDLLRIDEPIEYDKQTAHITEIHYIVKTEKLTESKDNNNKNNKNNNLISLDNKNKNKNKNSSNFDHYLAHITSSKQKVPQRGSYINNKLISDVTVYQIVIAVENNLSFCLSPPSSLIISDEKSLTVETDHIITDQSYPTYPTSDNEMHTPVPNPSIIININDESDIHKINKISVHNILKKFKDDIIKINDIYVAIRPALHRFLYLCSQIFENIILFTNGNKSLMQPIMKSVHSHLLNKLSKNKKEYNAIKNTLWDDIKYSDFCDIINNEFIIKNICKFGIDLSRVVMIDNDDNFFKGFEPNCIKISDYIINTIDDELMDKIWPILFECYKYNDIRYGLLGKQTMTNTTPICKETDSLAQTMQYLVTLQYAYFKSMQIIQNDCTEFNNQSSFVRTGSVCIHSTQNSSTNDASYYSTDDTDTDNTDNSDASSDTEEEKEQEMEEDEYGINKYNMEKKVEPKDSNFNCTSVFSDIGAIFSNVSSYVVKMASK